MGLEVGDEVIVHKPNNPDEYPTWVTIWTHMTVR